MKIRAKLLKSEAHQILPKVDLTKGEITISFQMGGPGCRFDLAYIDRLQTPVISSGLPLRPKLKRGLLLAPSSLTFRWRLAMAALMRGLPVFVVEGERSVALRPLVSPQEVGRLARRNAMLARWIRKNNKRLQNFLIAEHQYAALVRCLERDGAIRLGPAPL